MLNILGSRLLIRILVIVSVCLISPALLWAETEAPTVNVAENSKPLFDPDWYDTQQKLLTNIDPFLDKLRKKREVFTKKQNLKKIKYVQDLQSRGLPAEETQQKLMKFHQKQLKQLQKFQTKQKKKLDKYNYKKRKDLPNFKVQQKNQERLDFIKKQNEARRKYYEKIGKKGYSHDEYQEKAAKFTEKQHQDRVKFLEKLQKEREKYIKKVNNE